jgi:isocitrate/isopropylmalate dehydrogenase
MAGLVAAIASICHLLQQSSHQGVPYRIATIPGDGIGTEVVAAGVEVPHTIARRDGNIRFAVDHFDGAASTTRSMAA